MLRVHNTEPRLLCLLQMLTEIIQTYPCLPIDPMRRLKAALDPFYCWPCPFGPLAQRLIATAERELASPGAAFREGFLLEHPNLVLISGEHLSDLYQPVIPVYYDSSAPNARFLQLSLTTPAANSSPRSHDDGDHSDIGTHVVDDARNMLLDIFQRAGADVLELPSDAAEQLAGRQPEDLLAMYVCYYQQAGTCIAWHSTEITHCGSGAGTKKPVKLTLRHSSAEPKRQPVVYWRH